MRVCDFGLQVEVDWPIKTKVIYYGYKSKTKQKKIFNSNLF